MKADSGLTPRCAFMNSIRRIAFRRAKFEDVAGLAIEMLADRVERREANRLCAAGFEHGEVLRRDSDGFGEVVQLHFPLREHDVEVDDDWHV